jgi:hypothetical protein
VTPIDRIADRLSDKVRANRMALQSELIEQVAFGFTIAWICVRLVDLEMVSPAGQLDPIVSRVLGKLSHLGQR